MSKFDTRQKPLGPDFAKLRRSFVLSVRSLWLHKLRAFLSVLGIIIGTSAVIALMAFGEGSMQDALADIERQGAKNIIVRSVKPPEGASGSASGRGGWVAQFGLTRDDADALDEILKGSLEAEVRMRVFSQEIRYLERRYSGRVVGTTPNYAPVNKVKLATGRFLTEDDDLKYFNCAVLGANIAEKLFPFTDPLGKAVNIGMNNYVVVGVAEDRMPTGGSGGSQSAEDFNDDVYIPLQTVRSWFGDRIFSRTTGARGGEEIQISQVTLTIQDRNKVRAAGVHVTDYLMRTHPKRDWAVTVPLDRLEEAERSKNRFTRLLVMIASISLIVGGIGIMNIMLATVTERTREIGIRRALGAKRRDITTQFLVEAVVQTTVGGLLGVALGLSAIFAVPAVWEAVGGDPLPAKVHVPAIFLSLGVSIGVGVLFGWYPAQRAAKLDPIEALRHE